MTRRLLGGVLLALIWATAAEAVDRTVCASGCNHTTIAAALAVAGTGDVIKVRANESFVACTTLPNKGTLASPIIIRSDTADVNLPAASERVTAAHLAFMPNISACAGGASAFTTAVGARDYTLLGLEFSSNPEGYGSVITVGLNNSTQMVVADQPRNIILDRLYIQGSPVFGQKVGVDLNGVNLTLKNSYIAGIAGVAQDSQAVRNINGTGPILIENNFLEAAAENYLSGGDDPFIMTSSLVTAGATTTTATLNTFLFRNSTTATIATLSIGQLIALKAGATYHFTYVRSISTNTITYDAIPSAPDTGAGSYAQWGAITNGITIRRNHFSKPVAWRNPILSTPTSVSLVTSTASGTLAAGTYCYRVVARQVAGYQGSAISSAGSTEVCATLSAVGNIAVSWTAVANASHYRAYGRLTGAQTGYVETTGVTVTDTGAALTTSTIPSGTMWQVKTLFELKFGTNILISGNIFEYSWPGASIGYAFWLKANNAGGCFFCQTKDVIIEKNIIRHVNGGFNILARVNGGANISPSLENLTLRNNLLYDSTSAWGFSSVYLMKVEGPVKNFTVDHNTFLNHTGRGFVYFTGSASTDTKTGLVFTNNLARRETYGVFCTTINGVGPVQGSSCLNSHSVNGAYTFAGNVIAGASSSSYPANNVYSTDTIFQGNFENYGGGVNGDYALVASSTYRLTATDGLDQGADINAINAATAGVILGSASTTVPITVTSTGALTSGTLSVPYTTTLGYSGGTGAVTWTISSGTLPAGLTLTAGTGVIAGTPSAVGTSAFTVLATDSAAPAQTDTENVSITISAAPVALNITTTSPLTAGTVPLTYSVTLAATGGTSPYTYAVTSGTLPAGMTLSTAGVLAGVPTTAGVYTFTVTVTDQVGVTDQQAYSLTIAAETFGGCNRGTTVVGGITIQGATFVGSVQPTVCVRVGDVWRNTNFSPSRDYSATVASPAAVFVPSSTVNTAAHDVLSTTHTDAVTAVIAVGDLLVATDDGNGVIRWERMPVGAIGTVVTSTGDGLVYQTPSGGGAPTGPTAGAPAVQTFTMYAGGASVNTNVPALGTELVGAGSHRIQVDIENSTLIKITTNIVAACATSPATVLRIEYFDGSAWQPTGATSSCSTGYKDTNVFVSLAAGARAQSRVLRAYYSDGDGVADPSLSILQVRVR